MNDGDDSQFGFLVEEEEASVVRQRGMHGDVRVRSVPEQPAGEQDTAGTSAGNIRVEPAAPESPGNSDNDCIYPCRHSDHHHRNECVLCLHNDWYHHDDSSPGLQGNHVLLVLDLRNQDDCRV